MAERASEPTARPPAKVNLAEHYAALEATPRGRWFLAEYARRSRAAETDMLPEAIGRLEEAVLRPQRQPAPADVLAELSAREGRGRPHADRARGPRGGAGRPFPAARRPGSRVGPLTFTELDPVKRATLFGQKIFLQ
ncbi:hypothetical protein [Methyloceanibacter sp.]|uniref:hypothetical protein n=1 Tax=Methyloceanibacter sp. TaxID=1965321 RepID=UPI00351BC53E